MTSIDFNALTRMAEEAGYSTVELAAGDYRVEVKAANYSEKSNGTKSFGFLLSVVGGPSQGQSEWDNLYVPKPDAKPFAVKKFLEKIAAYGMDTQLATSNPEAAAKALIGRQYDVTLKRERPKNDGGFWPDITIKPNRTAAPAVPQVPATPINEAVYSQQQAAPAAAPAWQQRPI